MAASPHGSKLLAENKDLIAKISVDGLNYTNTTGDEKRGKENSASTLYWLTYYPETCQVAIQLYKSANNQVLNLRLSDETSALYYLLKNLHKTIESTQLYTILSAHSIEAATLNATITSGEDKGFSVLYWMASSPAGRSYLLGHPALLKQISSETLNAVIPNGPDKGKSAAYWFLVTESGRTILKNYPDVKAKITIPTISEDKLKEEQFNPSTLGPSCETNLYNACTQGLTEYVEQLLKEGGDPNLPGVLTHYTPLHQAIKYRHINTVKTLIEHKADLYQTAASGNDQTAAIHNALTLVACFNNNELINVILKYIDHAKLNIPVGNDNDTALHWAAHKNNIAAIEAFIRAGADLHLKNKENRTPFDEALERSHLTACSVLLKHGSLISDPKKLYDFLKTCDQRDPDVLRCLNALFKQYKDQGLTEAGIENVISLKQYVTKLNELHQIINRQLEIEVKKTSATRFPPPLFALVTRYEPMQSLADYGVAEFKMEDISIDKELHKLKEKFNLLPPPPPPKSSWWPF